MVVRICEVITHSLIPLAQACTAHHPLYAYQIISNIRPLSYALQQHFIPRLIAAASYL